jgi:hypothetical protein
MFPGLTTKVSEEKVASAATVSPKTDVLLVTGTTAIATIIPAFGGGFSGVLFIVPVDGTVGLLTTGNVAVAVTMPQNKVSTLIYSKMNEKWYPAISA